MASFDANGKAYIDLSGAFTRGGLQGVLVVFRFFWFLLNGADQKTAVMFYDCCKA